MRFVNYSWCGDDGDLWNYRERFNDSQLATSYRSTC